MLQTPAPIDLSAEELELWQRVRELWQWSAERDSQQIREALHPDYVGWDMSAPLPHGREAAIQSVSGESPRLVRYELEPLSVRVYEGSTGIAHYRYEATVESSDGQPTQVRGRWTEVYVKRGPHWLMVAVSGKPNPPDAPRARRRA